MGKVITLGSDQQVKIPLVRRPHYTIHIEYLPSQIGREMWMHCDVCRWSASVAREIKKDFETFLEAYGAPVFALSEPGDSKHQKWLRMYGFKPTERVVSNDLRVREQWMAIPPRHLMENKNNG